MEGILMREQTGKLFPVYTRHADELEQLRDIVHIHPTLSEVLIEVN